MLPETWLLFVAVSLVPVIAPGPAILLALSNALRYGATATFWSALGNSAGLVLLGFAVAFGLSALIQTSAAAFLAVKICGAAYLCYLGVRLLRDGKSLRIDMNAVRETKAPGKLFSEAFAVALTNPKALLFLAALIPPFVDHSRPVFMQVAEMSLTYGAMCFFNHMLLAYAGGHVRKFLSSERRVLALRRALGVMFISFAAALAAAKI
jgi:threonine/homoserine/homoserine lactone efflux protein